MGVQAGHRHPGLGDAHVLAGLVGDLDHLQHPRLFDPVAGLAQGAVGGHMDHPQVVVGQHHGVLFGVGVGGVDLGVAVEMGVPVRVGAAVRLQGLVHGLFVQGVGAGGVHLAGHGQLDHLFDTLERRVASRHAHLAQLKGGCIGDQLHVQHVDGAGGEQGVGHLFTAVDPDVRPAHKAFGLLQHFGVAHHDGAAAVVNIPVGQRLDGDLGAVAGRVAHGDANNGSIHR